MSTESKSKRGGARKGSGRKPIAQKMSYYDRMWSTLNENTEHILKTLIDGLDSPNEQTKIRCAEILLKKILPDRKHIESDSELELKIIIVDD